MNQKMLIRDLRTLALAAGHAAGTVAQQAVNEIVRLQTALDTTDTLYALALAAGHAAGDEIGRLQAELKTLPKPEGEVGVLEFGESEPQKCNCSEHARLGDDGETATCCGCGKLIAVGEVQKCPECASERIVPASRQISNFDLDYESLEDLGIHIPNIWEREIESEQHIGVHWCADCKHVWGCWVESNMWEVKNGR